MTTLFSYVVDHDTGFAPNPYGGFCTLVHCKHEARSGRRNVVELAQKGDWIIGTGGQSKKSCGNGRVVYIMRVDDKIPFRDYLRDARFHGRADRKDRGGGNKYALISKTFFYFGVNAIRVSDIHAANLDHPIEKKGPGFRKDFPESFIRQLAAWVQGKYEVGMHGEPCAPASKERIHKRGIRRKASVCRSTSRVPHVAGANRILLLRVGMDLGYGGLGPLFPDGRFEYVPIPENPKKTSSRSFLFSQIPARSSETLDRFAPPRYRDGNAHYDPEFKTFTYGDPSRNKRRQLLHLARNDILVFYAGLRPREQRRGSRLYVIGYFTVRRVHDVEVLEPWPPATLQRLWANAHFRRRKGDPGLVVVEGFRQTSGLLESAVALSDDRQLVLPDMEHQLGLTGSVMRAGAGRWVPDTHVASVEGWLRSLERSAAACQ